MCMLLTWRLFQEAYPLQFTRQKTVSFKSGYLGQVLEILSSPKLFFLLVIGCW